MTIYGVSQSSGVERLLKVEKAEAGVLLTICEHVGEMDLERIVVPEEILLSTIMEPPTGGTKIEGTSPSEGAKKVLDIEVRRNEVLLRVRSESQEGWDAAVGLDDLRDALEGIVTTE